MVFKQGGSLEVRKEEDFQFSPKAPIVERRGNLGYGGKGVAKVGPDPWSLETGTGSECRIQKIGHKARIRTHVSQCNNGFLPGSRPRGPKRWGTRCRGLQEQVGTARRAQQGQGHLVHAMAGGQPCTATSSPPNQVLGGTGLRFPTLGLNVGVGQGGTPRVPPHRSPLVWGTGKDGAAERGILVGSVESR